MDNEISTLDARLALKHIIRANEIVAENKVPSLEELDFIDRIPDEDAGRALDALSAAGITVAGLSD